MHIVCEEELPTELFPLWLDSFPEEAGNSFNPSRWLWDQSKKPVDRGWPGTNGRCMTWHTPRCQGTSNCNGALLHEQEEGGILDGGNCQAGGNPPRELPGMAGLAAHQKGTVFEGELKRRMEKVGRQLLGVAGLRQLSSSSANNVILYMLKLPCWSWVKLWVLEVTVSERFVLVAMRDKEEDGVEGNWECGETPGLPHCSWMFFFSSPEQQFSDVCFWNSTFLR